MTGGEGRIDGGRRDFEKGWRRNDYPAKQLGKWAEEFNKGMDRMRAALIEIMSGSAFGRFVKRHPDFKGHLTGIWDVEIC